MEIFLEISLITGIVALVSFVMKLLKQPFIVGFILSGVLVGPFGLNILKSPDSIDLFSQIGITILLYIVGLNLNPRVLKEVGVTSLITGFGQVTITSLIGLAICKALGFATIPSLFIAVALTFSSTIIVLKLLADRGDLNSLYGKISTGLLIVQDFIASFLLISLSISGDIYILFAKAIFLIGLFFVLGKFVLPKLLSKLADNQELLFIFSVTYGLTAASIFSLLGFSKEIGALIAGVTISSTAFATEISSRLKPLRDFFIPLFFILLGSQINFPGITSIILPAILLSSFVLIGNPLIVYILLDLQGFKKKTSFKTGLTMAQISEFSLILAHLGFNQHFLTSSQLSLITLVGLITISGSSYLILYSDKIYNFLEPILKKFDLGIKSKEKSIPKDKLPEVILFGYDKSGSQFANIVKDLNKEYLIVDYNPEVVKSLQSEGHPHQYGDAEDLEFLNEIGFKQAKMIISTIPNVEINKFLVTYLKNVNPHGISIVISQQIKDTLELYELGASYVIVPIYFGSRYLSHLLKNGLDHEVINSERAHHLLDLQKQT